MDLLDFSHHAADLRAEMARGAMRARDGGVRDLRVRAGGRSYPIVALDARGFTVAAAVTPRLGGLVEIHDAGRLVRQALVIGGTASGAVIRYDYKRVTAVRDAPPLDYVAGPDAAGQIAAT